ncbi:hypothetical protein [Clostridium perfringens]|uniref:phage lytic cycle repressor MrpR family protein n=1 Tax=Clostridium perfringens TaxID=1502 RepID=UPI00233FE61A|nr:hypothetical protein [Clostridium perfringens]MDC4245577.1 hypothetical protein [Clostridium perfringens]
MENNNYIPDYKVALEIKDKLDIFLLNKINFLEAKQHNDFTKLNYWIVFNKYIYEFEKMYNKDLSMFNEEEVKNIIKSRVTKQIDTLAYLKSVINTYEEWALEVGLNPTYNPCQGWDVKDVAIINKDKVKEEYVTIDDLFDSWERTKKDANNNLSYQEFATVLLARVGVKGEKWNELKFLKLTDIDFDKGVINVTNRESEDQSNIEVVKKIEVEKRILEVLAKAEKETFKNVKKNKGIQIVEFVESDYLIKSIDTRNISNIHLRSNIVNFFKEIKEKYIAGKDLFRCAEIDALLEIKERNGRLNNGDFKDVVQRFELKDPSVIYLRLKDRYINVTDDKRIDKLNIYRYNKNGSRRHE